MANNNPKLQPFSTLAADETLSRVTPSPLINGQTNQPARPVPPPTVSSMNRVLVGTLPLEMQLDADFAENQYGGQVPVYRLMPPASSGEAAVNSTVVSGTTKIAETANQASQTASTANSTANTANTNATTAVTGVTTINSTPVIQNVGGVLTSRQIDGGGSPILQTQDMLDDGSTYGRVVQTALTSNQVDPSKNGVLTKGSLPPMYSGAFTYTSTTSSITIVWSNLIIYRSDGTTTNAGSGSQAVTGLSAGETYNFLPYWNEATATLVWISSADLINPLTSITGAKFTQGTSPGYVSTTTSLIRPASVSVELWFHSTAGVECDLLGFSTNNTGTPIGDIRDFELNLSNSTAGAINFIAGSGTAPQSGAFYDDGQWHHVVGTYNGTTAVLYVDGAQVASQSAAAIDSFDGWWRIATFLNQSANATTAHCAVYSGTVLTAVQVANHFNTMLVSGVSTYEALVASDAATAYWRLQETSGTSAADSIGVNTGTYQNPASIALNQSQQVDASQGTPAIAWSGVPIQATQVAVLQGNISLGVLTASTPATGTGGGTGGGASGSGGGEKKVSG